MLVFPGEAFEFGEEGLEWIYLLEAIVVNEIALTGTPLIISPFGEGKAVHLQEERRLGTHPCPYKGWIFTGVEL